MNRLIKVDPTNTVTIRMEPGQKCHGQITLRNVMYTMPVAFRLQPLIKTRYTVKPQSGIISPLATVTIESYTTFFSDISFSLSYIKNKK